MTIRKAIVLATGLVVGSLALAAPAGAAWYGDGRWHYDNRWNGNNNYYGYNYRAPPVVYGTPYNYGYYAPPVVYGAEPGLNFNVNIR